MTAVEMESSPRPSDLSFLSGNKALPISFSDREQSSRADYGYLEGALRGCWIERGQTTVHRKLDFLAFDWVDGPEDRNWWWQAQGLPFLHWMVAGYRLIAENERPSHHTFTRDALFRWMERAMDNPESPLVWHDHAAAYRLRHLTRWLSFLAVRGDLEDLLDTREQTRVLDLVMRHVEFLSDDRNYSKHTNHGFDQALAVYTLYLAWGQPTFLKKGGSLARDRLLDELDFAFTEEGVHVENSPSYQRSMLGRLRTLSDLAQLGDRTIHPKATELIESATQFLSIITLPNGHLPVIGDTKGDERWEPSEICSDLEFFDYSRSGYYIARGRMCDDRSFHLIFKCSHLSNYHRHDDDLSFHLYVDGEVVLGDGGLGSYQEQDPKRIFLRSPFAHNVPCVSGRTPERDMTKVAHLPSLEILETGLVVGRTWASGGRITRTLDLRCIRNGRMTLTDEFDGFLPSEQRLVNFYLPYSANHSTTENGVIFTTPSEHSIRIERSSSAEFYEQSGWDSAVDAGVVYSKIFNKYSNATVIGWKSFNDVIRSELNVTTQTRRSAHNSTPALTSAQKRPMRLKPSTLEYDGITFPILQLGLERSSNGVIVFLPAVFSDKTRKKIKTAYFPRQSWLTDFDCAMCIADPYQMQLEADMGGSWFLHPERGSVLPNLARALREGMNLGSVPVVYAGSSMGGYAAMALAAIDPLSAAYAEAPQIVLREHPGAGRALKRVESLSPGFASRFEQWTDLSLLDFSSARGLCRTRPSDLHHVKRHVQPFMNKIDSNTNIEFSFEDPGDGRTGHVAYPKESAIGAIRRLIAQLGAGLESC